MKYTKEEIMDAIAFIDNAEYWTDCEKAIRTIVEAANMEEKFANADADNFERVLNEAISELTGIVNLNGRSVSFDACVNLMDDEIREEIAAEGNYDGDKQGFLGEYTIRHIYKYHEPFRI